jgi:flavin-dependent dehydrogenase
MSMRDLTIIGAGLAGSSIAAVLARQGWDVVLLERQKLPHHKVCGEFLSPEAQGSLQALGLYDIVAGLKPAEMTEVQLFSRSGVHLRIPLPGMAWGVSRYALDAALMHAAEHAGAEVQVGATAIALRPIATGHEVTLRDAHGEQSVVRSRAVMLACGRHPLAGLRPPMAKSPTRQQYVGVKCHYAGLPCTPDVRLYLFDGGYVGLSSIEGGRTNVCMLVTQTAFKRGGSRVASMIERAVQLNPTFGQALIGGHALPESEVAVAPVDTERVPILWDGYARIGDAAAMIPPLCGDGMAMALRAAALCAPLAHDFLRGTRSLASWRDAYCSLWHHEFDRPLQTGRNLQFLLSTPILGAALLGLGNLLPALSRRMVHATRGSMQSPA